MADLPITSDEGATPIVINDPTTTANVANVKAASTAAVAADNSLVVALSPNSPVPTGTNNIGVTGVAQGSTTSGEHGDLIQGAVTTTAPTYVTGQTDPLSLTTSGDLRVVSKTEDGSGTAITSTSVNSKQALDASVIGGTIAESTAAWTSSTTVNTALTMTVTGYTSVFVTLNQTTTITGGVVTFEISDTAAFTNAYPVTAAFTNDPDFGTTYTLVASTNQAFYINVRGAAAFRVRLSTVISGTGTVNVGIQANSLPGDPVISGEVNAELFDAAGNALTSTALDAKQGLDINLIASPSQSAASSGQVYVTSFEFNLPTNGTESPAVFIKNPSGSGKTLILKILSATCEDSTNGAGVIRIYGDPTTSANGTSQTISSTSVGGGAGASAMTAFSGPTASANGTILFAIDTGSGNVTQSASMPIDFDGLIRVSANHTLLITGEPSTNNMNYSFTVMWQEV